MQSLEEIFGSESEVVERIRQFAVASNREAARSTAELYFLYKEESTTQFDKNVAEEAIMYQLTPPEQLDRTQFNRFVSLNAAQVLGVVYSYERGKITEKVERKAEELIVKWLGPEIRDNTRLSERSTEIPWKHTVSLRPRIYDRNSPFPHSVNMQENEFISDEERQEYEMTAKDLQAVCRRFDRFNLSHAEVMEAIRGACDFFRIPYPELVYDLTDKKGGRTMFVNNNSDKMSDDILCYNMDQLIDLKVNSLDSFSLIMTHECAHRVFQKAHLPGVANGIWEHELLADFFMGIRAGLWSIDCGLPMIGLFLTPGSHTHPEGIIRGMFIRHGNYLAQRMLMEGAPKTLEYIFNKFLEYREEMMEEIVNYQSKWYDTYEKSSTN